MTATICRILVLPMFLLLTTAATSQRRLYQFTGTAGGDRLGQSCAFVGDVDGDSHGDFAFGVPGRGSDNGEVRIVSGANGATLHVLAGSGAREMFGTAIADVGDRDRDGRREFVVGSPEFTSNGVRKRGRVTLFSWRPATRGGFEPFALWTFEGSSTSGRLGAAVGGGEDVNADGTPDVIAGAPNHASSLGLAVVLSGVDGRRIGQAVGGNAGERFGSSVDTVGDNNGDGHAEWAVGAPFDDTRGNAHGAVHVFSGIDGSPFAGIASVARGVTLQAGAQFGASLANVGDFDGDGFDDLAVSAPEADDGSAGSIDCGYVALFRLASSSPFEEWWGNAAGDHFGASIAGQGDVDGDGRADVAIGAPGTDALSIDSGVVSVRGRSLGEIQVLHGDQDTVELGACVALGNVDASGSQLRADVIAGAPRVDSEAGEFYAWRSGELGAWWNGVGSSAGSAFGQSVAWVGDIDDDQHQEFVVITEQVGVAELRSGATSNLVDTWNFSSPLRDARRAGDVDGDGAQDVVIRTQSSTIIVSSATGATIASLGFVRCFAIGDVDADGLDDVLTVRRIGSNYRLQVLTGGAATIAWTETGPDSPTCWGQLQSDEIVAVALGDLDADRHADFAITQLGCNVLPFVPEIKRIDSRVMSGATLTAMQSVAGVVTGAIEDVDGDAIPELVRCLPSVESVPLWSCRFELLSGATSTRIRSWFLASTLGYVPLERVLDAGRVVGDLNGDGVSDHAILTAFDALHVVSGQSGAALFVRPRALRTVTCAEAGDRDGDGFADLLLADPEHDQDRGRADVFGIGLAGTPPTAHRLYAGCSSSNGGMPRSDTVGPASVGQAFEHWLRGGAPNVFTWFTIGTPGDLDLSVLGATGCRLRVDIWLAYPLTTDSNGRAMLPIALPNDPAMVGFTYDSQWVSVDPGSNAFGVTVSDVMRVRVGAFL